MFISRLTSDPNDIRIFGFATAHAHQVGEDDANAMDIQRRPWRANWPHYVRVSDAHFLDGKLADGVSLNEMMDALQADSFAPTQRNRHLNATHPLPEPRNENPRLSYSQQPSVELTDQGRLWLTERLQEAFGTTGEVPVS